VFSGKMPACSVHTPAASVERMGRLGGRWRDVVLVERRSSAVE